MRKSRSSTLDAPTLPAAGGALVNVVSDPDPAGRESVEAEFAGRGQSARVSVRVEGAVAGDAGLVTVTVSPGFTWKGRIDRLTREAHMGPARESLALCAHHAVAEFRSVRLRMLRGKAEILDADAARKLQRLTATRDVPARPATAAKRSEDTGGDTTLDFPATGGAPALPAGTGTWVAPEESSETAKTPASTADTWEGPPPVPAAEPDRPPFVDENVQFTVYRPNSVAAERWYPLLAFAHLSERPPDADDDEPDPVEEVRRQAEQVLGEKLGAFQDVTQDSRAAVPREGELTFVPEMEGVAFNPPQRTFLWQEAVHREEFRLRASSQLVGRTARGRLTVFLGGIVLADVPLAIRVAGEAAQAATPELSRAEARPYRRIFASYSHADLAVVQQFEWFARTMGDEYLRDWTHLRAGQV
ncbi:MAG: hypothetical protein KY476_18025, partial [Planctomycetes bacterium]|nr:hypothetical protein [Planctomycetota bacterium]